MNQQLRDSLWRMLLDADLEQRYWHKKATAYVKWDFRTKIFLAITTSSAVGGWALWADYPIVWKSLTVVSSLLSIVLPFIAFNEKVQSMTELHAKWLALMHGYDSAWRDQEILNEADIRQRLDESRKVEAELSGKAIALPGQDAVLGRLVYNEVVADRSTQ